MADEDYRRLVSCRHCAVAFGASDPRRIYCGAACKGAAWQLATGYKRPAQRVSAYFAGWCSCGAAIGGRRRKSRCDDCAATAARAAKRDGCRLRHLGRVVACAGGCGLAVCFLPCAMGPHKWRCDDCEQGVRQKARRVQKLRRKARQRGNECESVDPLKVFDRDRWRCQLCGVKTPREKRGTCADSAPELDHILPLSLGGPHSYVNTQCACRRCNQTKGATPRGQMQLALAA
mgnify:CR=1 FL=1